MKSYDASLRQLQVAAAQPRALSEGQPPTNHVQTGGSPSFQSCQAEIPAAAASAQGDRADDSPPEAALPKGASAVSPGELDLSLGPGSRA